MKKCSMKCDAWLLLVAGVLFWLNTMGWVAFDFLRFWPLLLVIWGLGKLFGHSCVECKV